MIVTLEINNNIQNDFFSLLNLLSDKVKILDQIEEISKNDNDYQLYLDRKDEEEFSFDEVKRLLNVDNL